MEPESRAAERGENHEMKNPLEDRRMAENCRNRGKRVHFDPRKKATRCRGQQAKKMEQTVRATMWDAGGAVLTESREIAAPGQMLVRISATQDGDEHTGCAAASD